MDITASTPLQTADTRRVRWLQPLLTGAVAGLVLCVALWRIAPALAIALPPLCAAAAIDARTKRLPDVLILPGFGLAALGSALWGNANDALFGIAIALLACSVLNAIRPSGIGLGDVKLLGAVGAALGAYGVTLTVIATGVVSILGFVAFTRRRTARDFAAGPFIVAGAVLAAVLLSAIRAHYPTYP